MQSVTFWLNPVYPCQTVRKSHLRITRATLTVFAFILFIAQSNAQDSEWLDWQIETEELLDLSTVAESDSEEKNFAVGDLTNNGREDMVVVRKQPFSNSTEPPKSDLLLVNVGGVLTDMTTDLAPGFLSDPTFARFVIMHDMDGDGWLDVIIANTFLQQPKYYANLGNDASGNWLGLEDQSDTRFPELTDDAILFCAVDAGDVTGDGHPDLYFVNYKQGGGAAKDFLLINDGTGHFTDESQSRLGNLRNSAFGTSVEFGDMDGDGDLDVVKVTTLFNVAPWNARGVIIMFNDGTGNFNNWQNVAPHSPYMITLGDFDDNGFTDIFVVDDAQNYSIRISDAVPDQSVTFVREFVVNGSSGFAGNVHAADLDIDGDLDIIISDVDVDIPPCNSSRKMMILQNNGGVFTQMYTSGFHSWATNSYDVGIIDVNNDGLPDFVNGKCAGYDVVMNKSCELAPNNADFDGDGIPDACDPCPTNPDPDCAPPTDYPVVDTELDIARQWNEMLLASITRDFARPTVHARNLYHMSIAMWDIWATYNGGCQQLIGQFNENFYAPFDLFELPPEEDRAAAVDTAISFAAYRILNHRFVNSPQFILLEQAYDEHMLALGHDVSNTSTDYSEGSAAAFGNYVAEQVIAYGMQDGSNEVNSYENQYYEPVNPPLSVTEPGNPLIADMNRWQPLILQIFIDQSGNEIPGGMADFLSPEWGEVSNYAIGYDDVEAIERDGYEYKIFNDPGHPPYLMMDGSGNSDQYQWTFLTTLVWSAHLDPDDGVMWDISPASRGNTQNIPSTFAGHPDYYDLENGGGDEAGYPVNPATGSPYTPNMVPRGDYTRVMAEYWADGPNSYTPPGHWYDIFNKVTEHPDLERRILGEGDEVPETEWNVKAYLALGGAVHDAAISAWSIKGAYDYIRPVSAIRAMAALGQSSDPALPNYHPAGLPLVDGFVELIEPGDPLAGSGNVNVDKIKVLAWRGHQVLNNIDTDNAGVDWILASNWVPYQRPSFVSPPFAGYVSGHTTFSRAAAEVLTAYTGDAYFPGGLGTFIAEQDDYLVFENGPSVDVELQWATYRDAANESALSRIWGGIHPPADDMPARVIGEMNGIDAFNRSMQLFDDCGLPPDVLCEEAPDGLNATVLSHGVVLNWNPVIGSVGCRVEGNRVGDNRTRTINVPLAGANQVYVSNSNLQQNTSYEWRVRCACQLSPLNATPWSDEHVFTLGSGAAGAAPEAGASEAGVDLAVNVFPNPASDHVNVYTNADRYHLEIYDVAGKLIHQFAHVNSPNTTIDISGIAPGTYFLTVRTDDFTETKHIVIN